MEARKAPPVPPSQQALQLTSSEQLPTAIAHAPRFHVLLVEDNLVNQKVLRKQLVKANCIVHVANHGQEALDVLRRSRSCRDNNGQGLVINVILMDVEMPVMDGLTCTRKVRVNEQRGQLVRRVIIIAVTANARKEQTDTCLAAGMDDVMPKPFRVPDLIAKMEKLLDAQDSRLPCTP